MYTGTHIGSGEAKHCSEYVYIYSIYVTYVAVYLYDMFIYRDL